MSSRYDDLVYVDGTADTVGFPVPYQSMHLFVMVPSLLQMAQCDVLLLDKTVILEWCGG